MRGGRAPGRGERERVARRVRAVLSAAQSDGGRLAPETGVADPPDLTDLHQARPSPLQWAPLPSSGGDPGAESEHTAASFGSLAQWGRRLRVRLDPGRRAAVAVGVAAVLAAVATGAWVRSAQPHVLAVTEAGPSPRPAAGAPASMASPGAASSTGAPAPVASAGAPAPVASAGAPSPVSSGPPVVVDVAGRVRRPGLYTLPSGARVYDAIVAAGGVLPGVNRATLNLAARVSDGQQILVGLAPAAAPVGSGSGAGAAGAAPGSASGPVNLNTATLDQLDALPGVGPVLAQHILDWRSEHGAFVSVDQLREVSGIGEVKFAALKPRVTV